MSRSPNPGCRVVRPGDAFAGKQGLDYFEGIATETVGSTGICMHLVTMPPGARAKAHLHETHETAIYVLSGEAHTWFGERLEEHVITRAGDMLYIPPRRAAPPGEPLGRPLHGGDRPDGPERKRERLAAARARRAGALLTARVRFFL